MNNEPFNILLADDDSADRLLFKEALEELEISPTVHTVNNGMELMAYLNEKKARVPHLIFLDLNMPRKNGLECLKEIRSIEKLKDVSIAIYSTSDNVKDMDETFSNGANIYITKPNDFNILKQLLYKAVAATYLYHGESFNRDNFILRI
jgi:CheY-like chemotaxis protein